MKLPDPDIDSDIDSELGPKPDPYKIMKSYSGIG